MTCLVSSQVSSSSKKLFDFSMGNLPSHNQGNGRPLVQWWYWWMLCSSVEICMKASNESSKSESQFLLVKLQYFKPRKLCVTSWTYVVLGLLPKSHTKSQWVSASLSTISLYFWSMQGKAAIWKFLTLSFCGGDSLCLRNLPWWWCYL